MIMTNNQSQSTTLKNYDKMCGISIINFTFFTPRTLHHTYSTIILFFPTGEAKTRSTGNAM